MHLPTPQFNPLPLYAKVIALVVIVGFVLLGIIGLILPIIPGVLFLFLAALLLTRVSRRASAYAHNQPWFRKQLQSWHATAGLSWGQRARLSFWVAAKAVVQGVAAGARFTCRSLRR
ncbi:DUF454 family protein [Pseudohongiella sp.]|uniref:Uncharacterized protein n=1 Tax=marine sediment metagenome TaxID=412755 RepID=A0A0F9WJK4_9ZZZZ|nr:DUF454 family protein [Pseudohongiella sp.]